MNWIDLVISLTVVFFIFDGINRGFLIQAFNILGFLFALVIALAFYAYTASGLERIFNIPKIAANPIGFLINWLVAETLFFGFLTNAYTQFIRKFHHLKINKYLGIIPAVLNALLFLSFVLLFVVSLPIKSDIKKDILESRLGSPLVKKATAIEEPFNKIFGPITKQGLTFLTVKPEEKGTVNLGFKQNTFEVDFAAEKRMLELVNTERAKVGAKALVWDEKLAEVGRAHSKDMFQRGYFSHFSPEGKDVGDRLLENGINYSYAGENLALAPDVNRAHTGLMNSPGHKRNILDPAFAKIGIGAIDGGAYGQMFTQVFTN